MYKTNGTINFKSKKKNLNQRRRRRRRRRPTLSLSSSFSLFLFFDPTTPTDLSFPKRSKGFQISKESLGFDFFKIGRPSIWNCIGRCWNWGLLRGWGIWEIERWRISIREEGWWWLHLFEGSSGLAGANVATLVFVFF